MLAALLLACVPVAGFPVPTVAWDYDYSVIEYRGVDGFRLYADGVLVADVPCELRVVCDSPGDPLGTCTEYRLCPGVTTDPFWHLPHVPLQRYLDAPAETVMAWRVTSYRGDAESAPSNEVDVCWPRTLTVTGQGQGDGNW